MLIPTYDILNCGPRSRFVANGKLIHNSMKLNQQNLPRGPGLRSAIVAPPGHSVVAVDLSQIELRVNMVMCGQTDVVDILRRGEDVYCNFGTDFFGRTITKADKLERLISKIAELSLGYGAGKGAFRSMLFAQASMIKDLDFCQSVVDVYRAKRPRVRNTWYALQRALPVMAAGMTPSVILNAPVTFSSDGVTMPSGFKIKYQNITYDKTRDEYTFTKMSNGQVTSKIYSSVMIENICQGLARDVVMYYHDEILRLTGYRMSMQVHDELIYVVPTAIAAAFLKLALDVMHIPPPFWPDLPVAAEGSFADNYADCK